MITLETMTPARPPTSKSPTGDGVVMGRRLPGERLTAAGWALIAAVFVLPALGLGLLVDGLLQWVFGWCLGVWCWF